MTVQTEVQERSARRRTTERARRVAAVATADTLDEHEEPEHRQPAPSPRTLPRIATVYRGAAAGEFRHARCDRELVFVGVRGGIEIDFYCLSCREHITLPEAALARVPIGQGS